MLPVIDSVPVDVKLTPLAADEYPPVTLPMIVPLPLECVTHVVYPASTFAVSVTPLDNVNPPPLENTPVSSV